MGAAICALDALQRFVDSQHVSEVFCSIWTEPIFADTAHTNATRVNLLIQKQSASGEVYAVTNDEVTKAKRVRLTKAKRVRGH